MSIAPYIKEIGRGKEGARSLSREQAADLMGQVLDGAVTDLELGAFCLAMRVKGETTDEMLGFLDATHARMPQAPADMGACVILPSYNGARKLPVLTPLLAALLAREGLRVLVHGVATDSIRTTSAQVWQALGWAFADAADESPPPCGLSLSKPSQALRPFNQAQDTRAQAERNSDMVLSRAGSKNIATNDVNTRTERPFFIKTEDLCPGLARLLAVRRVVGLRNSAHSLVKLLNPTGHAESIVVGSYTHPEYLQMMGDVFGRLPYRAMLLRGTEGEPVADGRRRPRMEGFASGERFELAAAQEGPLTQLPSWNADISAAACAAYIQRVLAGELPVPEPIQAQVRAIAELAAR